MKNEWLAKDEGELNVSSKAALRLVSMLHTVGPFAQHILYRWPKQNLSVKTRVLHQLSLNTNQAAEAGVCIYMCKGLHLHSEVYGWQGLRCF